MASGARKDPEGAAKIKSVQAAAAHVKAVEQSEGIAALQAMDARASKISADLQVMGRHKPTTGKYYSINPGGEYWRYLRERRVRFYRVGSKADQKAVGEAALLKAQGWFEVESSVQCSGFERHRSSDILLGAFPQTYAHVIARKQAARARALSMRKARAELRHPSVQQGMSEAVRKRIEDGDIVVQADHRHIEARPKDLGKAAQQALADSSRNVGG